MKNPQYSFGPFLLVDCGRTLLRSGNLVPVVPKALAVLHVLVKADGRVVTKQELLQTVWPDSFVGDANLTQNVFVLRKLMAADFDESPVETIATVGYRFRVAIEVSETPPPRAVSPMQAQAARADLVDHPQSAPVVRTGERILPRLFRGFHPAALVGTGVLLSAGMILAAVMLRNLRPLGMSAKLSNPRIAVVGFSNLSQSPEAAWFSGALTETLTTDLRADAGMRVLPGESVERAVQELRLKPASGLDPETLHKLCADLDCDVVISGSYLVSGANIRLDTHVQDADTGVETANLTSTRKTDELLPLVSQTGLMVREAFRRQATKGNDPRGLEATISYNAEAYRLYIEGQNAMHAYDGLSAVSLLQRSVELDSRFPLSHSALSNALLVQGYVDDAVREAHVAESLSGGLPRDIQLTIQAEAALAERRYDAAADTYRMLSESYPENAAFGRSFSWTLCSAGRTAEGIRFLETKFTEPTPDAHDPLLYSVAADCYGMMGDWTASLAWSRKGVDESRRRGANILYERLLTSESQALLYLDRLPLALSESQEALRIAAEYGDASGQSRALNRIGQVQMRLGKYGYAREALEQALAVEDRLGILQRKVVTLSVLSQVALKQHQYDRAASLSQEERTEANRFRQASFITRAELDVAKVQLAQGKVPEGQALIRQVAAEAARANDRQLAVDALAAAAGRRIAPKIGMNPSK